MIDSVSDIVVRAGDGTPADIVLRVPPSIRNPQNYYPDAYQVMAGVNYGPGLPVFQNYDAGTGGGYPRSRVVNE